MRIFIERFILAILAALAVLLAVTNPMEFSRTARILGVIVIFILAAIAAYFAEKHNEWRWERLRSLWWLWAIFGVSGGVSFALWLIPLIAGVPASDNEARLRALQSQLEAARQERDHATQNLATLQSHLASTTVELTNARQNLADTQRVLNELRLQKQLTIGPNMAINFASSLGLSTNPLESLPKTYIVVTSTPENERLRTNLEAIFNQARGLSHSKSPLLLIGLPNYEKDIDAPRLNVRAAPPGITVHGRTPAGNFVMAVLGGDNCLITHQTAETPDELVKYYHRLYPTTADVHDIIWLQIGSGFPLKSAGCLDQ